ncbi:MAG: HAD hydrolase-like protein [Eubacteriales bacterium]|nr:HAD hydrolase-like protein [Eubacteriales bacterium]
MRYKCLVFDHDDTVVNSTATIHHPCFQEYLDLRFPGRSCTLEDYFKKNFHPGFLDMCRDEYGMDDAMLADETTFWQAYVKDHVPKAYAGMKEIMERHKAQGGIICVSSWSFDYNILRDYRENGLPEPDAVFGWELPVDKRKPAPFSLQEIMRRFDLEPSDILMLDDLKPGYDMAKSAGTDFAAAGWANDIPEIENFMRQNCQYYLKTVNELAAFLA